MPYFIFDQALRCLDVCADTIKNKQSSENEEKCRKELIKLCKQIAESYKDSD